MSPLIAARKKEEYMRSRRDQILNASIQVFSQKGFADTKVEDIAKTAGISKGTVYLYFKNKEGLFTALINEKSFVPMLEYLMDEDLELEELLIKLAKNFLNYYKGSTLDIFKIGLAESIRFPDEAKTIYSEIILHANQLLADLLKKKSESDCIRKIENPLLTARAFMSMLIFHLLTQEVLGGKNITPIATDEWIDEIIQVFMKGLRKESE